eukprot:CAMPEP_0170272918 /NCGR_PEP_ID=MMETSP0116_2-20130129/36419_1 /TAXON_ID=400756 /ORGANISM="Durinskia baltica, Strain CSIRO CS-38" /LENGTH=342 /DNA_ID=CAMNT_0010524141 /DNA_START=6 /DNA_END=1032 /DNA_ORIENTATION=-
MIQYKSNDPRTFLRWRGSVVPRSACWALPSMFLTVAYHYLFHANGLENLPPATEAEELRRAGGVLINGCSNLIAFCSADPEKQMEVAAFQHMLTRLSSLLMCQTMSDMSEVEMSKFNVLSLEGIDPECMEYLRTKEMRRKIILQWIQRLVVDHSRRGTIDIAPPILSRVFQEFSIGIVNIIDANKLRTVKIPFHFAQMVWLIISFFSVGPMPLVCAAYLSLWKATVYDFVCVFIFWAVHFIAVEMEEPFGPDPNDLPLGDMLDRFNGALAALLEPQAQQPPVFVKSTEEIRTHITRCVNMAHNGHASWGRSDTLKMIVSRPSIENQEINIDQVHEVVRAQRQ